MQYITGIFILLASLATLARSSPNSEATEQVLKIHSDPERYNKNIRPPSAGPTNVTVNMFIRHIDLDDVTMELKIEITFRMQWRDQRIRFNKAEVPSVTLIDSSTLWIPDPFFKGSVKVDQLRTIHPEAYARIDKAGNIIYSSRFYAHQRCPMNLQRFPHDVQTCKFAIASYGFTTNDLVFHWKELVPLQTSDWVISADRFYLRKTETNYCNSKTNTGEYSCVAADFTLERVFSTYLLEWYIPCVCLVIVSFLGELLPNENIVARLIITIAPLMTLTASVLPYTYSHRASVSYTTAFDVFTGMSLLAIFVTLLHVIIGFYLQIVQEKKEPQLEEQGEETPKTTQTKLQKFLAFLKLRGDIIVKGVVVGGYAIFVFLYLLAYSG